MPRTSHFALRTSRIVSAPSIPLPVRGISYNGSFDTESDEGPDVRRTLKNPARKFSADSQRLAGLCGDGHQQVAGVGQEGRGLG